ncbi:NlpC/P60 family protein [Flectobacillus major]|uniref:NlpC/P60 family protein n=1 Tax=Flectobacillus major TaxID=103 RepID=UPI00040D40D9|nr:NlpC/P60 family protein [Flectobacillus major]
MKKIFFSKLIIAFLLCSALFMISCKNESPEIQESVGDATPEEIIKQFDKFDVIQIDASNIIGINGLTTSEFDTYLKEKYGDKFGNNVPSHQRVNAVSLTPNEQLTNLTNKIASNQVVFTLRDVYAKLYPSQPNGLAYVFDGKSDQIHAPHTKSKCKENLAGLDCSGMLYQGALKTGIYISKGNAIQQANVENWKKWLSVSNYTYISAEKTDINSWNDDDWKTGDIIIFNNGSHIGTISIADNNKIVIIHSQGSEEHSCDQNKGPRSGPKAMTSTDKYNWDAFTKMKLARLRFVLKDSYNISIRCSGMSNYLYTTNLSIDITKNTTFEDEVIFKDYDGSKNRQKFKITYDTDKKEFYIVSEMTDDQVPGGLRKDELSIPLASIGQPISSTTSFLGNMEGCNAEILLDKGFRYNADINSKPSRIVVTKNACSFTYSKK